MSLIIIRSKRNGISIEIPGGGVFGSDPDGDFVAQLGSTMGTVSLKDARTGRFFAKDHPFHQFRLNSSETDKGSGSSMGADAATVTNNLNAVLNRATKLAGIDEVELQSAAAGQILKYVTNAQGNLRWHNVAPDPSEVSEDTTPQLGGDLDVNGNKITSAANGDVTIDPDGTGAIVLKSNDIRMEGAGILSTPSIKLREFGAVGTNFIAIAPPFTVTADTTLTLPDGAGSNGQVLTTNGLGALSWTTVLGNNSPTIFGVTKLKHIGASDAKLAFFDQDDSNFVALTVPSNIASDVTFTLPVADGTSGQAMVTDGSGVLSFTTISGGTDTNLANTDLSISSARTHTLSDEMKIVADQGGTFTVATDNGGVPAVITDRIEVDQATGLKLNGLAWPSGDGAAGQVIRTNGSGSLSFVDQSGGQEGWHGSTTRIKLLPRDFVPSDGGRPAMIDDTNIGIDKLFLESFHDLPLYATVAIPTGYKATHVMVHGDTNNLDAVEVWEFQINSATGVSKGTGNVQTEINITDVTSSATNYLLLQVANGVGNEIHGGYVTIAAV